MSEMNIPEEFFEEGGYEEEFDFDPNAVITIRTSGGETRYVPAEDALTLAEVKAVSGLTFGAVQFFMNSAVINDETIVPVGSTVTAIGNVKGG